MEPWDGPASIAFTDGTVIGAVLDRNGLRPSRYCVTKDDLVIMASEVGVLDIPAEDIVLKERLHPGRIFLVDTARGRIVSDDEVKRELALAHPYKEWLSHLIDIEDLDAAPYLPPPSHETVVQRQELFGYTHEDLRLLLAPMATNGEEALGSMGTDTALAVLSDRPRLLYDYFKQMFAQVTNPPLDAIREELVTSMESTIGPEGNLLDPRPESCRQIKIKSPILDNDQLAKLRHVYDPGFRTIRLPMLFDASRDGLGMEHALEELMRRAGDAVEAGLHDSDPVRSRRRPAARADPEPARDGRRAPSSGARRHAHALRARRRNRRRARSAPLRAAARLRRGRGEPVSRVRNARRHDPPAAARRHHAREGGQELHQGAQQGHPQGDVQDGHLDAAELLRRAGVRGRRARPALRGPVLHAHGVTHRRHRHRRRRRRGAPAAREGVPDAPGRRARARVGRRVSVAPRRRVPPVQPGDGVQAPALDEERPVLHLQGIHEARRRSEPAPRDASRPARAQERPTIDFDRRGRIGGLDRQAIRHRRDVVRLDQPGSARDAGHRHESHGRQVEHRRGRRRSGAVSERTRTAIGAGAPSSRSLRRGSA